MTRFTLSIGWLIVMLAAVDSSAEDLRFTAIYEDGSVKTTNSLDDSLIRSGPGGTGSNPLRYLRDWHVKVELKGPYVQFCNGDILPGKVSVPPCAWGEQTWQGAVCKLGTAAGPGGVTGEMVNMNCANAGITRAAC